MAGSNETNPRYGLEMNAWPVLSSGSKGEFVLRLRGELQRLSIFDSDGSSDLFDDDLREALKRFQSTRGLKVDGICGPQTWAAFEETRYNIGDRLLALRSPYLRGDDIGDLQRRLNELGFDSGKVDGIFGPLTQAAVAKFQRNSGLAPDGIFGKDTANALFQLKLPEHHDRYRPLVGSLKEIEMLRQVPGQNEGPLVTIFLRGHSEVTYPPKNPELRIETYEVESLPESPSLAQIANSSGSCAVLLIQQSLDDQATITYYRGYRYVSANGRGLGMLISSSLRALIDNLEVRVEGLATPFLRETQMPAVIVEVPEVVHSRFEDLLASIAETLINWFGTFAD